MKRFFRKLHRWLGLLMAIQILAWMASGFYFSLFPITAIRGDHLVKPVAAVTPVMLEQMGSASQVRATLDDHLSTPWHLENLSVINRDGSPVWRIRGELRGKPFSRLVDAGGTHVIPALSEAEAGRVASEVLMNPTEPVSMTRVESVEPGEEYRGSVLPVWKVEFDDAESLRIYLDPWTGEVLAKRTDRWRIFDFLWMLHIMDFDARENFSHPLLQIAAFLGLLVTLSGLAFWALTTRLFHGRRQPPYGT